MNGAGVLAKSLEDQGIKYIFGVAGFPIIEVGATAQTYGIKYVGCRNEQAACYAAQAMGYLTRNPVVCLVVSGPGLLHAIGGLANATVNCWPVICIGGSSDVDQETRGAFQEWPQVESARLSCKHVSRPTTLQAIPYHVEKAVRECMYGRPGAVYIEIPGNLVLTSIEKDKIPFVFRFFCYADIFSDKSGTNLPIPDGWCQTLILGAAWSERGPTMVQQFLTKSGLPWLPTPGGKGVCTDTHPKSVAPARSFALCESDCVLLIGARLNWMLHFGQSPRFNAAVKIVQIDISSEEFHQNVPTMVALLGDIGETLDSMISELEDWRFSEHSNWMTELRENANMNRAVVEEMAADHSIPLNYYAAYTPIREFLAENDVLVVNEGANTMDIGRTMMPSVLPRRRLDAGTFGTMGVGQGYALAAALYCRDHSPATKVLVVQGDSAFGFSAMEIETIARYKLPVVTVVLNNSGIYRGLPPDDMKALDGDPTLQYPVLTLSAECRYDELCKALGGEGYFVRSVPEIRQALTMAFNKKDCPSLINVIIATDSERKAQAHPWLTRSKV
ncbi:hypothetical protein Angca_007828 [Angiostrongylus cantonensis]|nr:hypothetical protein Angca_007828 [Angiostrongylus cantonensis]